MMITIDGFIPVRASNLTDPNESYNIAVQADVEFSGDSANDQILDLGKWQSNRVIGSRVIMEHAGQFVMQYILTGNLQCFKLQLFLLCLSITSSISLNLFLSKYVLAGLQIGKFEIIKRIDIKMIEPNSKILVKEHKSKCVAKWVDIKSAPFICSALKPSLQKNRLIKKSYTFGMSKCDQFFDIFLQEDYIRLLDHYDMPSLSEIEKSDYCKWHGMLTHSTNECNVFHRQIQSAIDEGRLIFKNSSGTGGMS
jgi:hypothetical protein